MKLHPRINVLYEAVNKLAYSNLLDVELLKRLKDMEATQTEAIMTLHMGFNIPLEEVEEFVYQSGVFDPETINDVAYQTFTYLYYGGQ